MVKRIIAVMTIIGSSACGSGETNNAPTSPVAAPPSVERKYLLERIDEAAVVQAYADGFPARPFKEKTLIWHLYRAALAGRDIFVDQKYAPSLEMRDVVEAIIANPSGVD